MSTVSPVQMDYALDLLAELQLVGNKKFVGPMSAYMRDQFRFFGVKSPERKAVLAQFVKLHGLPASDDTDGVVRTLWRADEREAQYCAMELLYKVQRKSKRYFPELAEWMILHKSWWDTVDFIAPKILADYFSKYPEARDGIVRRWVIDKNLWLRRSSLIFQLNYKLDTDVDLLFEFVNRLKVDNDFFIRKAIGWALRQYSKHDPQTIAHFVNETKGLSGLSIREALKVINK